MEQFSSLILFCVISILILIFILPFLYINTLQNTIKATKPKNRTIEPYEVWLYFIPILGLFFHFNHILKITTTLKNDFEDKKINHNNESLFGANAGLTYSLISIGFFFYLIYSISILPSYSYSEINNLYDDNNNGGTSMLMIVIGLLLLIAFFLLIIFWSKMSNCKRILNSENKGINEYHNNYLNNEVSQKSKVDEKANVYDDIKKLAEFKDKGYITQEEFDIKKKQMLGL